MFPKVNIISQTNGKILTFNEEHGNPALGSLCAGQKGTILAYDKNVPVNKINQMWEIRPAPQHGNNIYSIHAARNPDNEVIRYTPLLPNHKILVWQNDPASLLQYWIIDNNNGIIRPLENKSNVHNLCLHCDVASGGMRYTIDHLLGVVGEKFIFNLCLESLGGGIFGQSGTITMPSTQAQMGHTMKVDYHLTSQMSQLSHNNSPSAPLYPVAGAAAFPPAPGSVDPLAPKPHIPGVEDIGGVATPLVQAMELDKIRKLEEEIKEMEGKLAGYEEKFGKIRELVGEEE